MGACQSHMEYYFGSVNVNISHLDVLSFMLGAAFAFGVQAMWTYCKKQKQATKHILKGATGQKWGQGPGQQPAGANYLPYNIPPMPSTYPPAPGLMQPTAPPAAPPAAPTTAVVPWKFSGNMAV